LPFLASHVGDAAAQSITAAAGQNQSAGEEITSSKHGAGAADSLAELGRHLLSASQFDEAKTLLSRVLEQQPDQRFAVSAYQRLKSEGRP